MATGGSDPVTELCEDLLDCDICNENFDYQARTPRILPCSHSFCETCLTNITKDGTCPCPNCREEFRISKRLPIDTVRVKLMDKRQELQSQAQGRVSCESCTEGAKATSRCQECEEFLCEDCCAAHRKMKKSKDHTLVSVTEVLKNPDKFLITSEKCERHSDEKLKVYCVTCSAATCSICAITLHKDCKKLVKVNSVLDEKKREILSLCETLDGIQRHFQAKAEESEAIVEAVESNLEEAVLKVESEFSEIINSATKRKAEIIGELRARANSDKLLLGEQTKNCRSLQAAAQTAAQKGRRCVTRSLASQVFSYSPGLEKATQELLEKTTAEARRIPAYVVMTDKLVDLKALMREIGKIESVGVTLPSIQLDTARCGSGCWVGADHCSLSNQPCSHSHSQPQSQSFRFPGTCGTEVLPGSSSYWQVRAVATGKPKIKDGGWLCEFGVATQQALQACAGDWRISSTEHCAMTVWIYAERGHVMAVARYRNHDISRTALAPLSPHSPVDLTLGLLLDTDTSRVHVIDVRATRVLCSSDIDLSTPVWPAVQLWPEKKNGARVDVEVQSGQQIEMSGDLFRLLQSVLSGEK